MSAKIVWIFILGTCFGKSNLNLINLNYNLI